MIIKESIHISASPAVVWRVTVDVDRWPEWSPTVTSVERIGTEPLSVGSEVRVKQPFQPEAMWVVTDIEDGVRFAWETRLPGLRMIATHAINPEGAGTRNVLRLEGSGPLAVLLWPMFRMAVRRALLAENHGLKERCEESGSPGT
jgi:hypothetical protein